MCSSSPPNAWSISSSRNGSAYGPTALRSRCVSAWRISVPLTLRIELSAPVPPPSRAAARMRRLLISVAISCISTSAICARNSGSSISGVPFFSSRPAMALSCLSNCLEKPMPARPVRSWVSRYLAQVQPSFSLPTRLATGTRTSSKNTSLTSCSPSRVMIGRTLTPGDFMSISRKEMPRCILASGSVRTRQKIQSALWPRVVQVFWPLTM
ncbi:hypothetical protein D9M71_600880 [compost metagenome]